MPTTIPDLRLPLSLVALLAAVGLAQSGDEGILRGPAVKPREVPGIQEQYVPGDLGRFSSRERPTPLPAFIQVLREIATPESPEDLRLTPEQLRSIRAELQAFTRDAASFLETHGDEMRGLVSELPKAQRPRVAAELGALQRTSQLLDRVDRAGGLAGFDPPSDRSRRAPLPGKARTQEQTDGGFQLSFDDGGTPPGMDARPADAMMKDEAETAGAAERLQALHAAAPSTSAVETRIWQLLTDPQREHVGAALDELREAETRRAQEERLSRQLAERRTSADAAGISTDLQRPTIERMLSALESGEIPEELWDRLPERARTRLEALPEDQRADALRRFLRTRFKDGQSDARPSKPGG